MQSDARNLKMTRTIFAVPRATDFALEAGILQQLLPPERGNDDDAAWLVSWKSEVGRCLVAARALPAGSIVFREQPLIVAPAASAGEDLMAASAIKLLAASQAADAADDEEEEQQEEHASDLCRQGRATRLLQGVELEDEAAENLEQWTQRMFTQLFMRDDDDSGPLEATPTLEACKWALNVAATNVHAARDPTRGVLGILASMMEHSCEPTAMLEIGPTKEGSVFTLKTSVDVKEGDPLTICYVGYHLPRDERRRQLAFQYGFHCECKRCLAGDE